MMGFIFFALTQFGCEEALLKIQATKSFEEMKSISRAASLDLSATEIDWLFIKALKQIPIGEKMNWLSHWDEVRTFK